MLENSPTWRYGIHIMKKFSQKRFRRWFILIGITFLIMMIPGIVIQAIFLRDFKQRTLIEMEYFDRMPCRLAIPVRYLDGPKTFDGGLPIYDSQNGVYALHLKNSVVWLECTRMSLGGLAVFNARYEIIDPAIRARLLEMAQKHQLKQ